MGRIALSLRLLAALCAAMARRQPVVAPVAMDSTAGIDAPELDTELMT